MSERVIRRITLTPEQREQAEQARQAREREHDAYERTMDKIVAGERLTTMDRLRLTSRRKRGST